MKARHTPTRLLIVVSNKVGDAVMCTPTLRLIREAFPNAFIGALVRPGIDQLLDGSGFIDRFHVRPRSGPFEPMRSAPLLRAERYDTALLFPNSFSSAATAFLARIPRRLGYARDGRRPLLTASIPAPRTIREWARFSTVDYHYTLARSLLLSDDPPITDPARILRLPPGLFMQLTPTPAQEAAAADVLRAANFPTGAPYAVLNPGGSGESKFWPAERFGALARHLHRTHGLLVGVSGSPAEADICDAVATAAGAGCVNLARRGIGIGSLIAILRDARLMVANDTGPRHMAAAVGTPLVSLFGPTDPRRTTIPSRAPEIILRADPTLPESEVADDHPQRCRIDRITLQAVIDAADRALEMTVRPGPAHPHTRQNTAFLATP